MGYESILAKLLSEQGLLLLDGGLATELEAEGYDLDHPLWSFRLVAERPDAIVRVHGAYLEAGADLIIASSYQGSIPGLVANGYSESEARELLGRSIDLAVNARDAFWIKPENGLGNGRRKPLVGASIGPYGAYLADGSEYRGNYGLSRAAMHDFHAERFGIFAVSQADFIACETLPGLGEGEVLAALAMQTDVPKTWLSFACRDGHFTCEGQPIAACAELVEASTGLIGLGINCTAPQYVASLLRTVRATGFSKLLIVYPNSGEQFVLAHKSWSGDRDAVTFVQLAREWAALGAQIIGGCCRTGPGHICALRIAFP